MAKSSNATYRLGPELEICGYGCNDHFYEIDTFTHSWQVLGRLLRDARLYNIICDVGMPVMHKSVRYNCRVVFLDGKILLIRPKMFLANDGNYRESRWFTPWMKPKIIEDFHLPTTIQTCTGQIIVPFGDAVISSLDTKIGFEVCEELFTPNSPHVQLGFEGVEIIANGSASHHELRKLHKRIELILNCTSKNGGLYLYSNQQGCDGERVYYDGCALIAMNNSLYAQGSQFSIDDIEIVVATLDLDEISTYRSSVASRSMQAAKSDPYPIIKCNFRLCQKNICDYSSPMSPKFHSPEEEIAYGPACWLWDYLRRSRMRGFFLPLSGGIDSCSTALIVSSMCRMVYEKLQKDDVHTKNDVVRIIGREPTSLNEFTGEIFCTCYMASKNSSAETRVRAMELADAIGSYHIEMDIDGIYNSYLNEFSRVTSKSPHFKIHGGTEAENLALQNIQARSRMVLSYLMAQLTPWTRGCRGSLLVLGSANVDEWFGSFENWFDMDISLFSLRGYFTKYDCSSADLNPIGSISKSDLKNFVKYFRDTHGLQVLEKFINATPTAELEPLENNHVQTDEADMGFTYEELSAFGKLRKISKCGPVSTYEKLAIMWKNRMPLPKILEKTKLFFKYYAINRHKMTTITPAYYAESYSPDDNRFDLRPFLYPVDWKWQFEEMDKANNNP